MMDDVLECLCKTIADLINCSEDEVTPEARLVEDLGFESIDFLELAMTVSSRYKVELDEDGLYLSSFRSLLRNASPEEAMEAPCRLPSSACPGTASHARNGRPGQRAQSEPRRILPPIPDAGFTERAGGLIMKRRVVVVSVGVLSPAGVNWPEFNAEIFRHRDWFAPLPDHLPYPAAARVKDEVIDSFFKNGGRRFKYRRYYNRATEWESSPRANV